MTGPVESCNTRCGRAQGHSASSNPVEGSPASFKEAVEACTIPIAGSGSNSEPEDNSDESTKIDEAGLEISRSLSLPYHELWREEVVLQIVDGQDLKPDHQLKESDTVLETAKEKIRSQFELAKKPLSDALLKEHVGKTGEVLDEKDIIVDREITAREGTHTSSIDEILAPISDNDETNHLTAAVTGDGRAPVGLEVSPRKDVSSSPGNTDLAGSMKAQILDMIQAQQAIWERGKQMVVTGLRLMLRPDSLGEIEVSLKIEDGSIAVTISAEKQSTAGSLHAASDQLVAGLTDIGFEQAKLTIGSRREFVEDHGNSYSRAPGDLAQSTPDQSSSHGGERHGAKRNSARQDKFEKVLPSNSGRFPGRVSGLYL